MITDQTVEGHPNSAQDPDPDMLDPQDFDFLDSDPQKYADSRLRIEGVKYQPKIKT